MRQARVLDEEGQAVSLSTKALEQLRDRIIRLELQPGALLDESALIKQLGVGRTPIREALQRLACEGLVNILPRRGTFVASLSLADLQQIFELRQVIEGYAAALAAERADEADLCMLDHTVARLDLAPPDADAYALIEIDRDFHRALAKSAHNAFLEYESRHLYDMNLRLWYFALAKIGPMREAIEQHRVLVSAIRCHDRHAAEAAMRKHVTEFQARIRKVI